MAQFWCDPPSLVRYAIPIGRRTSLKMKRVTACVTIRDLGPEPSSSPESIRGPGAPARMSGPRSCGRLTSHVRVRTVDTSTNRAGETTRRITTRPSTRAGGSTPTSRAGSQAVRRTRRPATTVASFGTSSAQISNSAPTKHVAPYVSRNSCLGSAKRFPKSTRAPNSANRSRS